MTFAERLRTERTARGLSKRALALRAGLSPAYITLLEQGRRAPTRPVVEALGTAMTKAVGAEAAAAQLLEAAGYAAGGEAPDGAPSGDDCRLAATAAVAALLTDERLPLPVRAKLDEVMTEIIGVLHARLRQRLPPSVNPIEIRRLLLGALPDRGSEEAEMRRVLEELRSPVYDL